MEKIFIVHPHSLNLIFVYRNRKEIVIYYLIEQGERINKKIADNYTHLYYTCENGNEIITMEYI